MTNSNQKNRRARRVSASDLTAKQRARIDRHVQRIRKANAGIVAANWKLADELAALVAVFKDCHGRKPWAKELARLVDLDRDADRMLYLAKLAVVFPNELRHPGVGVRVYEAAYKRNQALKSEGRTQFSVAELADFAKRAGSASGVSYTMKLAADSRDRPARNADSKEIIDKVKAGRSDELVLTAKRWLRVYEDKPHVAVAAGIKLLPDYEDIERINDTLVYLGAKYILFEYETRPHPHMAEIFAADARAEAAEAAAKATTKAEAV